jgi:uncharacterized membrane-anchored protein
MSGAHARSGGTDRVDVWRAPAVVLVAAGLAGLYALVPAGAAVWLALAWANGEGTLGELDGDRLAQKGVLRLIVALLALSGFLVAGVIRVIRRRDARPIVVPLLVVLAVGSVLTTVDALGDESGRSLLIGLGILGAVAMPVMLLRTRRARSWLVR